MAGPVHIGVVTNPSASFTRPENTTQYTAGDLVANSATAASVTAMEFIAARSIAGPVIVRRARLYKSDDDVTLAKFRLHVFKANPVSAAPANGDNGALLLNVANTLWVGSFAFDMTATNSPDIFNTSGNQDDAVPLVGEDISVKLESGYSLYGLLEATDGYTPGSAETFTAVLECWI
jgi:hypothetical protein